MRHVARASRRRVCGRAARGGAGVAGIVYAAGVRVGAPLDEIERAIASETGAIAEAGALAAFAPELSEDDLARVRDLVGAAAAAVERALPAGIPPTTFT